MKELSEWTSSLPQLGRMARQIDDSDEGSREQHGRLSMCFFVSGEECYHVYHKCERQDVLLPKQDSYTTCTESSCRQSRPDWSSSASRGCVHVHDRLTGGSISGLLRKRATANPFTRASCYSWSSNGHTSTTVWQKIRSVPHFLQPPAINNEPESNAKMYVNQRRDEMARTWKHILRHERFHAKYRYVGVFSNAVLNHFPLEDFSQTNGNQLVSAPRAHFRQKLKIDQQPKLL